MASSIENSSRKRLNCRVDLGRGQTLEVEISRPSRASITAGPGIVRTSLWFRRAGGAVDLHVNISRQREGLQIAVDRGDAEGAAESRPRLIASHDPGTGNLTISAVVGTGRMRREILLDQIAVE